MKSLDIFYKKSTVIFFLFLLFGSNEEGIEPADVGGDGGEGGAGGVCGGFLFPFLALRPAINSLASWLPFSNLFFSEVLLRPL